MKRNQIGVSKDYRSYHQHNNIDRKQSRNNTNILTWVHSKIKRYEHFIIGRVPTFE